MKIRFHKYQGAGNDFVMVDNRLSQLPIESKHIAKICDRHFGVGADGLMLLRGSERLDCSMSYFNADGSAGEMCGNGARCFALFAHHLGVGGDGQVSFDSLDGDHVATLCSVEGDCAEVEVEMCLPHTFWSDSDGWFVNTGVPHFVVFVDDVGAVDVVARGRQLRYDERFAEGANINFVEIVGDGKLRIRTYERGVENETLACGTGATAAAVITSMTKQPSVCSFDIEALGGQLSVSFDPSGERNFTNVKLRGGACRVFEGSIDLEV